MSANTMSFNQVASIMNSILSQVTGAATITATNTADFVTQAQTALLTGYDPVMNAISQMVSRTIFRNRPYSRKFKGIEMSQSQWGNAVRKLSIADKDLSNSQPYLWPVAYDSSQTPASGDGQSVDMQKINKPDVLQTNFYGANVWSDSYTMFRNQIDCAFKGPEELASFLSMVTGNMSDKLEQVRENVARYTVVNFIGGIIDEGNNDRVVHLVSEYNAQTGLSLTAQTVYQPDNFPAFMRWASARIKTVSNLMTERSEMFQTVVNSKKVIRHTPKASQRLFLYAPAETQMETMVKAQTFHDGYLGIPATETVNYWQAIDTPDSIAATCSRIGTNGSVVTGSQATEQAGIFALLCDNEALGYAPLDQRSHVAPFNAAGEYQTTWFHETERCYNDHTEKGVVFLLD